MNFKFKKNVQRDRTNFRSIHLLHLHLPQSRETIPLTSTLTYRLMPFRIRLLRIQEYINVIIMNALQYHVLYQYTYTVFPFIQDHDKISIQLTSCV
jgi:hypothetical protein